MWEKIIEQKKIQERLHAVKNDSRFKLPLFHPCCIGAEKMRQFQN